MFWNYLSLLLEIGWDDFLDIGLTMLLLALGIHVLRSARARAVSLGLIFFVCIFFFARHFELQLTTWLLQGIAAVLVVLLIVIFQAEIRRFLEQFPTRFFLGRPSGHEAAPEISELLTDALWQLSADGRGALLILPGRDLLESHLTGGVPLDGQLSKPLVLSIFDPNSPGHDGAVVVKGSRVASFGSRLPLSEQLDKLQERGTRHAAALGLAERSDALVLVVSEETSRISLAEHGDLRALSNPEELREKIDQFLAQHAVEKNGALQPFGWFSWYGKDLLFALPIALVLWLILVPAAVIDNLSYQVPIVVQNIPDGYRFSEVVPADISVVLKGARRDLFQIKRKELEIRLDGTLTRFGRKTFPITKAHLLLPPEVEIVQISPEEVQVLVDKNGSAQ